jgi:hypothetical protein
MFTEARKLHLIEEMIKLKSEKTLIQIEQLLGKATAKVQGTRPSAQSFVGKISKKDIALMESAIEDGCEQIHPDDWS